MSLAQGEIYEAKELFERVRAQFPKSLLTEKKTRDDSYGDHRANFDGWLTDEPLEFERTEEAFGDSVDGGEARVRCRRSLS